MTFSESMAEFSTSRRTRILYALTSLKFATPSEAIARITAFFIVDVKNLPAAWYATCWFFYTIYNALNNSALGYLSDRTRSRWGRRIPFVLFGGLPYGVAFALIFSAPCDGRDNPVGFFWGICIVVWETIYTALATGYYGLLPEMFAGYRERTDVAAKWRKYEILFRS